MALSPSQSDVLVKIAEQNMFCFFSRKEARCIFFMYIVHWYSAETVRGPFQSNSIVIDHRKKLEVKLFDFILIYQILKN